jgi:hypothetical protein
MNAETDKIRDTFAEQLASFDDRLEATADDVDMLTDIQEGIGQMLASSGGSEAEIRRVLQERYEAGQLRKETFQLVKSMLDRFGTEPPPARTAGKARPAPARTAPPAPPTAPSQPDDAEDSFGATTVIPADALPINDADARVQVGSVLRDRFMLQQKVSGGSMGVVYKALDRRLAEAGSEQPYVAIKVLSPLLAENGDAPAADESEPPPAPPGGESTHAPAGQQRDHPRARAAHGGGGGVRGVLR